MDFSDRPNYEFMRESINTTTDLLISIEQDIAESRQLIKAEKTEKSLLSELVTALEQTNSELVTKVSSLQEQLVDQQNDFKAAEEELFTEFEEKILACNGEIERVVLQCNEANDAKFALEKKLQLAEDEHLQLKEDLAREKVNSIQSSNASQKQLLTENEALSIELAELKHNHRTLVNEVQIYKDQAARAHLMHQQVAEALRKCKSENFILQKRLQAQSMAAEVISKQHPSQTVPAVIDSESLEHMTNRMSYQEYGNAVGIGSSAMIHGGFDNTGRSQSQIDISLSSSDQHGMSPIRSNLYTSPNSADQNAQPLLNIDVPSAKIVEREVHVLNDTNLSLSPEMPSNVAIKVEKLNENQSLARSSLISSNSEDADKYSMENEKYIIATAHNEFKSSAEYNPINPKDGNGDATNNNDSVVSTGTRYQLGVLDSPQNSSDIDDEYGGGAFEFEEDEDEMLNLSRSFALQRTHEHDNQQLQTQIQTPEQALQSELFHYQPNDQFLHVDAVVQNKEDGNIAGSQIDDVGEIKGNMEEERVLDEVDNDDEGDAIAMGNNDGEEESNDNNNIFFASDAADDHHENRSQGSMDLKSNLLITQMLSNGDGHSNENYSIGRTHNSFGGRDDDLALNKFNLVAAKYGGTAADSEPTNVVNSLRDDGIAPTLPPKKREVEDDIDEQLIDSSSVIDKMRHGSDGGTISPEIETVADISMETVSQAVHAALSMTNTSGSNRFVKDGQPAAVDDDDNNIFPVLSSDPTIPAVGRSNHDTGQKGETNIDDNPVDYAANVNSSTINDVPNSDPDTSSNSKVLLGYYGKGDQEDFDPGIQLDDLSRLSLEE